MSLTRGNSFWADTTHWNRPAVRSKTDTHIIFVMFLSQRNVRVSVFVDGFNMRGILDHRKQYSSHRK